MTRYDTDRIRRYYERHTSAFVAFGQGGGLGALHRAVWGPGARTRDEAFRYVEDRIAEVVRRLPASGAEARLIDLGCGVAGSLCYLAEQLPVTGLGLTLSPTQAELGRARIAHAGLTDRLDVISADYTEVPPSVQAADVVFAIESFVHAPDAEQFLASCRRLVRPGGALVICDDFLRAVPSRAHGTIERFRSGWHINTLVTNEELTRIATRVGFAHEETLNLSPYLELGRVRDRAVDAVAPLLERLPWRWRRLDPWLGGSALQECLRQGWLGYDLVTFRAPAPASA